MAYKIFLTPRSQADIALAFAYIEERSPEAAGRWYNSLMATIATLQQMPTRCPVVLVVGIECRFLVRGRYRIFFDIEEDSSIVRILTVRHSARREITDEEIQQIMDNPTQ